MIMLLQEPQGFPGTSAVKKAGGTGGLGSIPGSERSPGEGDGSPLQCSEHRQETQEDNFTMTCVVLKAEV